jgi:hypothetical protein
MADSFSLELIVQQLPLSQQHKAMRGSEPARELIKELVNALVQWSLRLKGIKY